MQTRHDHMSIKMMMMMMMTRGVLEKDTTVQKKAQALTSSLEGGGRRGVGLLVQR